MPAMPLVSVIIINYNNAKYLAACINSIRAQTFKNLEILLIDNSSTDSSWEIANEIAAGDSRIKCHQVKHGGGVGAVRNYGMDIAAGDFIMFMDSDDLMVPTAIEAMTTIQNALDCSLVVGSYAKVPESFFIPDNATFPPAYFMFDYCVGADRLVKKLEALNMVLVWGKLIHRDLLTDLRFMENVHPHEDTAFMLRLYARVETSAIGHGLTNYYRQSANSVTLQKERDSSNDIVRSFNDTVEFVGEYSANPEYREFVRNFSFGFLRAEIKKMADKIADHPGREWMNYRARYYAQLKKLVHSARAAYRLGHFQKLSANKRERFGLWLFARGFIRAAVKYL